ncbi:MAG: Fur family transcriptional regulator [Anaerolineales bacterium]|nr:Fur family transcriptional regulator [Anaerolineales bacterium]
MFSITATAEGKTCEGLVQQAGFRLTQPRKAVLQVLSQTGGALKPEEILDRAGALCPGIGLVTVYRTLTLLADLGCIRRVHQDDHCHGYVRANLAHGHHVVCRTCQQAVEFPGSEDIGSIIGQVARQTGFRIDDHLLELMGICPDCQAQGGPGLGRRPADGRGTTA